MYRIKYAFGTLISAPLLPFMYFQGKKIRAEVPTLPEAKDPEGTINIQSHKTIRVLLIGESTMAGVGVTTHAEGFAGAFATELATQLQCNVHWKVHAKSGYTAQKVARKIIPTITENQVDLIVVGLGANDAFGLHSPWKWQTDIRLLLSAIRLKYAKTPLAFINMPPIKEFPAFTPVIKFVIGNLVEILGEALSHTVRTQANTAYHSEVISLSSWSKRYQIEGLQPRDFFSDGVHPSRLTYQTWAKDMAGFVVRAFGKIW
jgi:lysophospholipase L1-like esterase